MIRRICLKQCTIDHDLPIVSYFYYFNKYPAVFSASSIHQNCLRRLLSSKMIGRSIFSLVKGRGISSAASPRPAAAIVGGTKGIGLALGREWLNKYREHNPKLFLLGRTIENNSEIDQLMSEFDGGAGDTVTPVHVDLTSSESIGHAVKKIATETPHIDFLFHTAGHLHNIDPETGKQIDSMPVLPERSMRALEMEGMIQAFTLNTFAPALVIKHFAPLLKRGSRKGYRITEEQGPPVVAALSARVGSLRDNRKGGWTSYRASKAALNMVLLNAHHEFGMGKQKIIVLSIHPGTVDTNLSKPFQAIAEKQYTIFSPEYSAKKVLNVSLKSTIEDSGNFFAWDGEKIPW
jgi:NAD(P)-dependent dehydrogenase (short-subunit alcohol dehydrogenase family)